jgi:hypothetical protein
MTKPWYESWIVVGGLIAISEGLIDLATNGFNWRSAIIVAVGAFMSYVRTRSTGKTITIRKQPVVPEGTKKANG